MTGHVYIQTALKTNRTFLKKSFFTAPFKVADITENKKSETLRLMLMSSSPGILDGDDYHIKIELVERSSLELETQSYQRLFAMEKGASQNMEVHLGANSSFTFLPHPTVPHAGSYFKAKNKIFLTEGCNLVWGEVLTCGRKLRGEAFCFNLYHSITEIFLNNKLVIKENLLIKPASINVSAIGQLEGYTHQATLIYLNETAIINDLMPSISEWLNAQSEITVGISMLPVNSLIIRLLGNKAEQLHNCLKTIAKQLSAEANMTLSPENNALKVTANAS
jgi:urease accessory protein